MPMKYVLETISLMIYPHCGPSSNGSNRPRKSAFLMWTEPSIMRFKSPSLVLDFTATPEASYVPKHSSSPKKLGQVTSVACQPDTTNQSNGFENTAWEMLFLDYQDKAMQDPAAATVPAWREEKHLTTLAAAAIKCLYVPNDWFPNICCGHIRLKVSPRTRL